ncbi:MAG: MotA/TolQ/ExbB proton channel family protein [candidate division KSB1 bacterium]|nr:MotA/TolQ/ExbB proton channel family protein [candidate division KSB1 bacterium]
MQYIHDAFVHGGSVMYLILVTMIAAIAIAVERFVYISMKNRIDAGTFAAKVIELVQRGSINAAVEYCRKSKAALPRIVLAGLENYEGSAQDIQNALELAALTEIPKLEKRTPYLSMIANVATLLGLLGTIFGLIQSFQAVAQAEASQKAALLSAGISMAMNTTAFGLLVAIPCLIVYSVLQEQTSAIIDEINENVARIYQRLVALKESR